MHISLDLEPRLQGSKCSSQRVLLSIRSSLGPPKKVNSQTFCTEETRMKKLILAVAVVFCFSVSVMSAASDDDTVTLRATLRGDNETPPTNSQAPADFKATPNPAGTFTFPRPLSGPPA